MTIMIIKILMIIMIMMMMMMIRASVPAWLPPASSSVRPATKGGPSTGTAWSGEYSTLKMKTNDKDKDKDMDKDMDIVHWTEA